MTPSPESKRTVPFDFAGYGSVSPHYEFVDLANKLSDTYKVIIKELISSVYMNKTAINEIKRIRANCEDEMQLKFPESVPVFYILSKESVDSDSYWEGYHQDMVKNNENGRVEIIEGNHYVHLSNEEKVVELTRDWLQNN